MGRSKGSRLKGWIESPNALRWRLDQYEAARLRRACPVGTGPFLICDPERARNVRRQYTQKLFCVYWRLIEAGQSLLRVQLGASGEGRPSTINESENHGF
jgi:hypothetical protein